MSEQANHLLHLLNDIERAVVFLTTQPAVREVCFRDRALGVPDTEPIPEELL